MKLFKKRNRKKKRPLQAKGVQFGYKNNQIFTNLKLTIQHNQIVAIVGQSGEGKSTFLHLASGVMRKRYSGSIKIQGMGRRFSEKDVGFVPQEIALYQDLSIKDNIIACAGMHNIPPRESLKRAGELMELMQLNIPLDTCPKHLSGGQKVRLNIITSLLHDPKLLLLDEPFVGLDYKNRKILWHFLKHLKRRKRTILLTTHMLVEAEHNTDRIILLKKGRVFASGKLKQLKQKLGAHYIMEIKASNLSKTRMKEIENYCITTDATVIDKYGTYIMFSILDGATKSKLTRLFNRIGLDYEELAYREPNLDELFLKVGYI